MGVHSLFSFQAGKHIIPLMVIAILCMFPLAVMGQDPVFTAAVQNTTVQQGQQFAVSFTFQASGSGRPEKFSEPVWDPFVKMSGPNLSTSISIVNFRTSSTTTYTVYVYARETGVFTVNSAEVAFDGKTYRSAPLKISVVKGQAQPQQSTPQSQTIPGVDDENIFLRAMVNRSQVYQGEPITVSYKLFTRLNVGQYSIPKAPANQGFWTEDLEQPGRPDVTTEMVNGKQYQTAVIKSSLLYPTRSGRLKIDPLELRTQVQVQTRRRSNDPFDIFNDPFFGGVQTVEHTLRSNIVDITVLPLPEGAPDTFFGAVGKYTISAKLDKNEVNAGEPITFAITVRGTGNIALLSLPKVQFPADFEVYEPKISDNISKDGGVISGSKTAEYLLVPRNAGTRVIEPVRYSFFDIGSKKYATLSAPSFTVTVNRGKEIQGGSSIATKSDVRLLGEDIRYIRTSPGRFVSAGTRPWEMLWFILGTILPPVFFVSFLFYRIVISRQTDTPALRARKAGREAVKRLKHARALMKREHEGFYAEITRTLLHYASDRTGVPLSRLTLELAMEELIGKGQSSTAVEKFKDTYHRAEFSRFSPGASPSQGMKEIYQQAVDTINELEMSQGEKS